MNTAIVTGASRGIGRDIALRLGKSGWNLGLIATNGELLEEVADQIRAGSGGKVALETLDVGNFTQVEEGTRRLVEAVGRPSLLINNAGRVDAEVPIWEADPTQLQSVVATNVLGSLYVERAVLPHMIEGGGGRVINLVSGAGARSWGMAPAYTVSKAGQLRNVGDLALVGADVGIRAFGIAPGVVATDMTAGMDAHVGRTDYTPVTATLDLIDAIAEGRLDAWSGTYLRADVDTPDSLVRASRRRGPNARMFGVYPWGEDDPLG